MIAFVCNTPVQLMRTIQMVMSIPAFQDTADLYVGTTFQNHAVIAERARETGLFRRVTIADVKPLGRHVLMALLYGKTPLACALRSDPLDKLVSFNIESEVAQALYHINRSRPGFAFYNVEDGPSVYLLYKPRPYAKWHPCHWLGIEKECYHMDAFWSCCPLLMKVPEEFTDCVMQLPCIDPTDDELSAVLNDVFAYQDDEVLDRADVLIMEESFYTDNCIIDNADFRLYDEIRQEYPQLSFAVKLHPRTKENRFAENFPVMPNTGIPWELYALNRIRRHGKKLLMVGICCITMFSDKLLFDDEGPKLILAPMFYDKVRGRNSISNVSEEAIALFRDVRSTYRDPGNITIAEDKEQIFASLDRIFVR